VVTDGSGTFRIPNLPPGEYALNYEADTYRPVQRTGIVLNATTTIRVDAELLPEVLKADEVTVIATPPTVDIGSTRSGVTIDQDFTSRIAVAPPTGKGGGARSFEQLAQVAPTASTDTYGASISGTTSVENVYMVNGMSVGDPGFGYNASPLSIEFVKEANIVTGGYLPEYGRGGGGVIEAITKQGTNEFHGSVWGNVTPLQITPKFAPAQDSIRTTSTLDSVRDVGLDIGGPLIKDKLFFYLGADFSKQNYRLTRDLIALQVGSDGQYLYDENGLIRSGPIEGTRRETPASQSSFQYIGDITWTPTADDRIKLTHFGTPTWSGGDGAYSIDYETGSPIVSAAPVSEGGRQAGTYNATAWKQIFDSYDTNLRWTHSTLNKRLNFDTIVAWHHQRSANLASDGSELGSSSGLSGTRLFNFARTTPEPHPITDFETLPNPGVCRNPVMGGDAICPTASYSVGGPQILHDRIYDRYQVRELATLVAEGLGHHIIKAGAEVEYGTFDYAGSYPGGPANRETASGLFVNDIRRFGALTAPDEHYDIPKLQYKVSTVSFGAFLQDSWSIMDKITVNAGMRYDTQSLYTDKGDLGLTLPNQWSPRVGVIFDPTQKGRAKLFANYAIYYQSMPMNIMSRAGAGEPQAISRRPIANCQPGVSPNYPDGCDDPNALVQNPNNSAAGPNNDWYILGIGRTVIDPDLKPQSSDEFSAGGEYEIIPGGRLGLTYIHRSARSVMEDMSRDEGSTYFVGNPGTGLASDFPKAERLYDAGILNFTKVFSHSWLAQASYTLAYLRGNWEGLFRAQTGQLDPGTNSDFDLRSLTVNRTGALSADARHSVKLFVAKDFELAKQHHLTIGGSYRAQSGGPTNYLGAHILYSSDEVFLLPRGSGERLPWQHSIDAKLSYTFFESPTKTLAITVDAFNLFNFQAVADQSQRYTIRPVEPITGKNADQVVRNGVIDPSEITAADGEVRPFEASDRNRAFGAPTRYQAPLTLRFGIKGTF
jgi:outer membrane receptor protein involved in Fe transport